MPTAVPEPVPTAEEGELVSSAADVDEIGFDAGAPTAPGAVDYRSAGPAKFTRPVRTPLFKTLGFRRTVIPVMLTLGASMIAFAAARWFVDAEAPIARLPGWVGAALIATGTLMLLLGVANAFAVRAEMAKRPA